MKHILLLSFLLLPLQSNASAFNEANDAYHNKDFAQAIQLYKESLINSHSLEQHYNLANAYFENKDYPHAILHYQKALTFAPHNPDILKNLDSANQALKIVTKQPSSLEVFTNLLSSYTWGYLFIISLILATGLFVLSLFLANRLWIQFPFWISIFLIILCLVVHFSYSNKLRSGIVLSHNAPLRISATSKSPSIAQLPEGSSIKVMSKKHKLPNWTFVKSTSKNQEGWLNKQDFSLIW